MMERRQYTTNRATAWAATLLMAWAGLAIAGGETGAEERFAARIKAIGTACMSASVLLETKACFTSDSPP